MTWDYAFAERYDEWSAHMTKDVGFYVELAREADGPIVELAVGNGRVAVPVAQATGRTVIGWTRRRRCSIRPAFAPRRRASRWIFVKETCGTSSWTSRLR